MALADVLAPSVIAAPPGHVQAIRALDVTLAALGLAVFALPMLLIAVAIRLESPGAPIFRQTRLGKDFTAFTLLKFRSMRQDAEAGGARWAAPDDPRVTRLGRILRKTRADELPQLLNVLRGEMSLVGPRPIRAEFAAKIAARDRRYNRRFLVKPGLTGYAQLHAPYGSDMSEQLAKIPFDLRHVEEGLRLRAYLSLVGRTALRCVSQPFGR